MKLQKFGQKFNYFASLLIVLITLGACAPTLEPAAPSPTIEPTPTANPSAYPFAMETPEGGFETTPQSWIFYQVDPEHRGGNIVFQDTKGSEPQLIDDPSWMGPFQLFMGGNVKYTLLPSPTGKHIAFYVTKEDTAQIWVLNIQNLKIEAKIDLFYMEPDEDPANILNRYLWRQKMMQWSPNGQYLAFVGGLQGSEHNLLIHDFDSHETNIIAEHVQHLGLIDWSPDSHSVVYVSLPELGKTVPYASVWAATIEGHYLPIADMSISYMTHSLGWLDYGKIVVEDLQWEYPPKNLRIIDVNSGELFTALDDFTTNAYLLPDWQLLFANVYEGSIYYSEPPTEMEQGIYIKQLGDGYIDFLIPSKTAHLVDWYPEIGKFLVFDDEAAFLYDLDGEIAWEAPLTTDVFPSPDGNYVLFGVDPLLELRDPDGSLVWSIPASSTDRVIWLPDSSGFLHFGDSDLGIFVSLYLESTDWHAEILDNLIWTDYDYKYFIMQ